MFLLLPTAYVKITYSHQTTVFVLPNPILPNLKIFLYRIFYKLIDLRNLL